MDLMLRRRELMMMGGATPTDNYVYYDVMTYSANTTRSVITAPIDDVAEMWVDGVQITPVASMTFAASGAHPIKVLLNNPAIIPDSMLNAGHYANCVLPACVTNIGKDAFRNFASNNATSSLTCLAVTPPALSGDPFVNRHNITVYVPDASVAAYQSSWSNMTNIVALSNKQ
jgi:hypothetical protein